VLRDPESIPLERALDAWVESGANADVVADILTRSTGDSDARERMRGATSRRRRASLLSSLARNREPA
jgi:hypothetical protein